MSDINTGRDIPDYETLCNRIIEMEKVLHSRVDDIANKGKFIDSFYERIIKLEESLNKNMDYLANKLTDELGKIADEHEIRIRNLEKSLKTIIDITKLCDK